MNIIKRFLGLFTSKKKLNKAKMDLGIKIATHLVNNQGKCPISFAKAFLVLCEQMGDT